MKKFTIGVLVLSLIAFAVFCVMRGVERFERAECIKWQAYSQAYPLYQSTDWQKAQCEAHEIFLNL